MTQKALHESRERERQRKKERERQRQRDEEERDKVWHKKYVIKSISRKSLPKGRIKNLDNVTKIERKIPAGSGLKLEFL